MDPSYDTNQAQIRLEEAVQTFKARKVETQTVDMIKVGEHRIVNTEEPLSWRIINENDGGEFEEEIFHLYGILCKVDLPPIRTSNVNNLVNKAKVIRQHVRLTGLGTPTFQNTLSKIENVHELMMSNIGHLQPWRPAIYEGRDAIDITARYFSSRQSVPNEQGQDFGPGVDPNGVLAKLRGQDLIHGRDNKVEYLKEYKNSQGETKIDVIEPQNFNIGDIVRATVSFVAFPRKDNPPTMILMLRALTYIESIKTETQKGGVKENIPCISIMKRKKLFDDYRETREGIERMSIDDDENEAHIPKRTRI